MNAEEHWKALPPVEPPQSAAKKILGLWPFWLFLEMIVSLISLPDTLFTPDAVFLVLLWFAWPPILTVVVLQLADYVDRMSHSA